MQIICAQASNRSNVEGRPGSAMAKSNRHPLAVRQGFDLVEGRFSSLFMLVSAEGALKATTRDDANKAHSKQGRCVS